MFDKGVGFPLVLVPGVQGRWEWMRPAAEALARRTRTISYSLCGDPGSGARLARDASFDAHVDQLDRVLDRAGADRVALCGVSFGGWIALRYAAKRPERVGALVLASTPGPHFELDLRQQRYVRNPRLLFPLFVMTSRHRLRPEVVAALPDGTMRRRWMRGHLARLVGAPASPGLMARRMRLALSEDFVADCAHIAAPTLVVTGERGLDRVVPVDSTGAYAVAIAGAERTWLPHTGHIGLITQPDAWADIVAGFVLSKVGSHETATGVRSR